MEWEAKQLLHVLLLLVPPLRPLAPQLGKLVPRFIIVSPLRWELLLPPCTPALLPQMSTHVARPSPGPHLQGLSGTPVPRFRVSYYRQQLQGTAGVRCRNSPAFSSGLWDFAYLESISSECTTNGEYRYLFYLDRVSGLARFIIIKPHDYPAWYALLLTTVCEGKIQCYGYFKFTLC